MKKLIRKVILWCFRDEIEEFDTVKDWINALNLQSHVDRKRINRLYDELHLKYSREMSDEEWRSHRYDIFK